MDEWDALLEALRREKQAKKAREAGAGITQTQEVDFCHELNYQDMPTEYLYCVAKYVSLQDCLTAHNQLGDLQDYPLQAHEVTDLACFLKDQPIDPEEIDVGLTQTLKDRALALAEGSEET